MSKFSDVIKEIIGIGTIKDPDNRKQKSGTSKVTNKILLKELVDHFNDQIEELSVGRRLLYPMYHPASVIYTPSLKAVYSADIGTFAQRFREDVEKNGQA